MLTSTASTTWQRIRECIYRALPRAGRTCLWLLKIILPISLAVQLLQYSGILATFAGWLEPTFRHLGLPGETAIIFITSAFCPLYAPIALIVSMSIGIREATILALMCLVSHNLILESTVQSRTGSSFWGMTTLRLVMSFVIAFVMNKILPGGEWGTVGTAVDASSVDTLGGVLWLWLLSSLKVVFTIGIIVTALMILHYIMDEFKLMKGLSTVCRPIMSLFGLPKDAAFLWLVGNVVGLAYGSAIMIDEINAGKLSRRDSNLLNNHLAINHSMLEDTLIFAALGIPALWLIGTRICFAILVVWGRRGYERIRFNGVKGI